MTAQQKPKLTNPLSRQLKRLGACSDAVEWAGNKSLAVAWRTCERADWMLWLLERSEGWSRDALNRCALDLWAARSAARSAADKRLADIVRKHYPKAPTIPTKVSQ